MQTHQSTKVHETSDMTEDSRAGAYASNLKPRTITPPKQIRPRDWLVNMPAEVVDPTVSDDDDVEGICAHDSDVFISRTPAPTDHGQQQQQQQHVIKSRSPCLERPVRERCRLCRTFMRGQRRRTKETQGQTPCPAGEVVAGDVAARDSGVAVTGTKAGVDGSLVCFSKSEKFSRHVLCGLNLLGLWQ